MTDWLMSLYLVSNSWEDLSTARCGGKNWEWHEVKTMKVTVINDVGRK